MTAGFQTNLLTGLAVYLAAGGLGATWKPNSAYTVLELGIVLGAVPQAPDRVITLQSYTGASYLYGASDSPNLSDSVLGVQVRCRWGGQDPRPVNDLQDAIFDLLHGKEKLVLSTGVTIVQLLRQSATTLGQDENMRWSNVSNYYATVWRPSPNRT